MLAAHFIAVTLWVECFRLLPQVPRERRIAFTHGLGGGLVSLCLVATTVGYGLAANLPQLFAAAILMLTPLAFLLSTARNCRQLADILALVLGLALFPLAAMLHTGVDILISGVLGRHHRLWRSPLAGARNERFHRRLECAAGAAARGLHAQRDLAHARACGSAAASTRAPNCWSG